MQKNNMIFNRQTMKRKRKRDREKIKMFSKQKQHSNEFEDSMFRIKRHSIVYMNVIQSTHR